MFNVIAKILQGLLSDSDLYKDTIFRDKIKIQGYTFETELLRGYNKSGIFCTLYVCICLTVFTNGT